MPDEEVQVHRPRPTERRPSDPEVLRQKWGNLDGPSFIGMGRTSLLAVPFMRYDYQTNTVVPVSMRFFDALRRSKQVFDIPYNTHAQHSFTIGRERDNRVPLVDDPDIEGWHASVKWKDGVGYRLWGESKYGTSLQKVSQIPLHPPTRMGFSIHQRGGWMAIPLDERRKVRISAGGVDVIRFANGQAEALGGIHRLNMTEPIFVGGGAGNDIQLRDGMEPEAATCIIAGRTIFVRKDSATSVISIHVDDGVGVGDTIARGVKSVQKRISKVVTSLKPRPPSHEQAGRSLKYLDAGGGTVQSSLTGELAHENQDRFGFADIIDEQGHSIGKRAFLIDGAGGEGKAPQIRAFVDYAADVCVRQLGTRLGLQSLRYVDEALGALKYRTRNAATGTIGIVELLNSGTMHISSKGDVSVLFWKPEKYTQNRAPWLKSEKLGGAEFQLQNPLHNHAQALYAMGGMGDHGWTTGQLDDRFGANIIKLGIAIEGDGECQPFSVQLDRDYVRNNGAEAMVLFSDGGRGGSELISRHPKQHQIQERVNQIMVQYTSGRLTAQQASQLATQEIRRITGDSDDITCVIVDLRAWKASDSPIYRG